MKAVVFLLAVLLLPVACKRRSPPVAPPAAPPSAVQPAPPSAPPAATTIIPGDQNLPVINNALKAYIAKHKKAPAKLDDLAKEGFLPFVPGAPPGSRYELDAARGEVRLVSPMVK